MTFAEYQLAAGKTAIYPDQGKNPYYAALGLAGEAGEVANKIKKIMRDHGGTITEDMRTAVSKEIGGVLWYCAALASEMALCLDDIAIENVKILASRMKRGVISGSGDNR